MTALCSAAIFDMVAKMVVPTSGSLLVSCGIVELLDISYRKRSCIGFVANIHDYQKRDMILLIHADFETLQLIKSKPSIDK
ncbi:MAG: hypothetical protein JJU23_13005 [Cyclobacteriaceae bacterium]|nr:hypothetical protein [Cyclobacteriaceae bacterium]